jgi:hypothetical protein
MLWDLKKEHILKSIRKSAENAAGASILVPAW